MMMKWHRPKSKIMICLMELVISSFNKSSKKKLENRKPDYSVVSRSYEKNKKEKAHCKTNNVIKRKTLLKTKITINKYP